MRRAWRRLCGARGGVASLEFGMVAPAFLILLIGLPELALYGLTAATLDIGVRHASRYGALGTATPSWMSGPPASRQDAIRRTILHYGGNLLTTGVLTVSFDPQRCGAASLSGGASDGPGDAGQVVFYCVTYEQPTLPLGQMLLQRGAITHRSTAVVRNEPFAS